MIALTVLIYIAYILGFLFMTICVACGLFWLAELTEEYTVLTKKVLRLTILAVVALHVLLMVFENMPSSYLLLGIVAHGVYYSLLKDFPFIDLYSVKFVTSAVCVIGSHTAWFFWFRENYMEFGEVASFFIVCVWMVPFAYFLSLSANDYTLPYGVTASSGEEVTADDFGNPFNPNAANKKRKRGSTFLAFVNFLKARKDSLFPSRARSSQKLF
eukprot:TRINITY_DN9471_c0_g1_i1.p1 TRINITY_DN9471_c0_g1~~TRINITY_DN9471_c0_g1_i1.p1  ORF type:complete len:214 (+),score=81.80 TRINITY_DN9471_c0_g1_i1:135-776(+)